MMLGPGSLRPVRVLCVDSDRYHADMVHHMLTLDGYRVQVAADGTRALHLLQENPPDLLITDLTLTDMHGVFLCAKAREIGGIAVLVLSMQGSEEQMIQAFQHGADAYVVRPVDMRLLLYRVRALISTEPIAPASLVPPIAAPGTERLES